MIRQAPPAPRPGPRHLRRPTRPPGPHRPRPSGIDHGRPDRRQRSQGLSRSTALIVWNVVIWPAARTTTRSASDEGGREASCVDLRHSQSGHDRRCAAEHWLPSQRGVVDRPLPGHCDEPAAAARRRTWHRQDVLAEAWATVTGAELIRLQCYEGIEASQALYDWDFPRQILHLRAVEAAAGDDLDASALEASLFHERFLLERPI